MNVVVREKPDGGVVLLLILEPGNLHRLQNGLPISKRVEDFFPDGIPRRLELEIAYSETPIADAREFSELAEISFDERTPVMKTKSPHCPECKSTIEELGVMNNESPLSLPFCAQCGCVLGVVQRKGTPA